MIRKKKILSIEDERKAVVVKYLRQGSRFWKYKTKARALAKVRLRSGTFKNGNPKYIIKFQCADCGELFVQSDTEMDHIHSVIDPYDGYIDANTYLERAFPDETGYQCLCKPCHKNKSEADNKIRRKLRAEAKKKLEDEVKKVKKKKPKKKKPKKRRVAKK